MSHYSTLLALRAQVIIAWMPLQVKPSLPGVDKAHLYAHTVNVLYAGDFLSP